MKTSFNTKISCLFLIALHLIQIFLPGVALAGNELGYVPRFKYYNESNVPTRINGLPIEQKSPLIPGGPGQPEAEQFTPIQMDDMVDPFTGDFNYNIPLMDVDGYPINLAYTAGVSMAEESSWTGLGWNVNVGAINRNKRGLADDFDGSEHQIVEQHMKNEWEVGIGGSASNQELFGFELNFPPVNINYNNYRGYSFSYSIPGPSYGIQSANGFGATAHLGLSGSSSSGPSLNVNAGLSFPDDDGNKSSKSVNIGTAYSSRAGLTSLTLGVKNDNIQGKNEKIKRILTNNGGSYSFLGGQYSPSVGIEKSTFSISGQFSVGIEGPPTKETAELNASFTNSKVKNENVIIPLYGTMYSSLGKKELKAQHDFSTENEGGFSKSTPSIAFSYSTPDIFMATGQGISGSYILSRNSYGYFYEPSLRSTTLPVSLGVELASAVNLKVGANIQVNYMEAESHLWEKGNGALSELGFKEEENIFRESGEMSIVNNISDLTAIGGSKPVYFKLDNYNTLSSSLYSNGVSIGKVPSGKTNRNAQNQFFSFLTIDELDQGLGLNAIHPNQKKDHKNHIGQICIAQNDGKRYYYGIAAYNLGDVSVTASTNIDVRSLERKENQVSVLPVDFSEDNDFGQDHMYRKELNPAYASNFLLTAVTSNDYIDNDGIKGPSSGDFGTYYSMTYKKLNNYTWRNPVTANEAYYSEGTNFLKNDDKANVQGGAKELWYIETVKSKNQIAVFYTSSRNDGYPVNDPIWGGLNTSASANQKMQKLDSIALFNLSDYEQNGNDATVLKKVVFNYSYRLCARYPGNINQNSSIIDNTGKLTLESIYFTYEKSYRGKYTGYAFEYGSNPNYQFIETDRWGGYKALSSGVDLGGNYSIEGEKLTPLEFPYTEQNKAIQDVNAAAWALSAIDLPSGGRIEITYESDDYAYVQNRKAMEMFLINGIENQNTPSADEDPSVGNLYSVLDPANINNGVYFKMKPNYTDLADYLPNDNLLYFRVLSKMGSGRYEYVPGYAEIDRGQCSTEIIGGEAYGFIKFKGISLSQNDPGLFNPLSVATILMARKQFGNYIPPSSQSTADENAGFLQLLKSVLGSAFSSIELITGPNLPLFAQGYGHKIVLNKSYIRLNNPNKKKLGGGHRVKEIRMKDAWSAMTGGEEAEYGTRYIYELEDGTSSGVAAYEPMLGNDENPCRSPLYYDTKFLLAPDDINYQMLPFGESLFPAATVGYSRVVTESIHSDVVQNHGTGKTVLEFYTQKDFPTRVRYTSLSRDLNSLKHFKFGLPLPLVNISTDMMAASQGFVVETNDMHGKKKRETIYAQKQNVPLSSIEYFYKANTELDKIEPVTVIDERGNVSQKIIGLDYQFSTDFRENTSNMQGGSLNVNVTITIPPIPIPFPNIMGSYSSEYVGFRTASTLKHIHHFGILMRTVAMDNGSTIETENIAFDSKTGQVLLTRATTNFNDTLYSMNYPAHWIYENFGLVSENEMQKRVFRGLGLPTLRTVSSGVLSRDLFNPAYAYGDEIFLINELNNNVVKGWVTEIHKNHVKILDKNGSPISASFSKILLTKSGKKNRQTEMTFTVVTRDNPLTKIKSGAYKNVLQASAIEFMDDWKVLCDCQSIYSKNDYYTGRKGRWVSNATYSFLSTRNQSLKNNNSNIRDDGFFETFSPFYLIDQGEWSKQKSRWTYASEITNVNTLGSPVETKDALSRYTATISDYRDKLPSGVAVNARLSQIGFESFEDQQTPNCMKSKFSFDQSQYRTQDKAHSGYTSIKVTNQDDVTISVEIVDPCEQSVECTLELVKNYNQSNNLFDVSIVNGSGDYSFETVVVEGDLTVEEFKDSNTIRVGSSQDYELELRVKDNTTGCVQTITLSHYN